MHVHSVSVIINLLLLCTVCKSAAICVESKLKGNEKSMRYPKHCLQQKTRRILVATGRGSQSFSKYLFKQGALMFAERDTAHS
jgi:hypothetical protein